MKSLYVLLIFMTIFASACHRNCPRTHFESVAIQQNSVPNEMELTFCKGGPRPETVTLKIDPNSKYLDFGNWSSSDRGSRYDGSCADDYRTRDVHEELPIALKSESFGKIKLCRHQNTKNTVSLIPIDQPCSGSVAQVAPVDDCMALYAPGN